MEPSNVAVVRAQDRHLRDHVTHTEQFLDGALSCKDETLLVLDEIGGKDSDDTETAIGDLVLLILAHDHDPLAKTSLQLLDQFASDHQAPVVP